MVTNFCSAEGSRVRQALHDTDSIIKFQNFVFLLYLCYGYLVTRLSGYPVTRLPGYLVIRLSGYPVIRLSGTRLFYHACWRVEFSCCGKVLIVVSNVWVALYLLAWRFRCCRGALDVVVALQMLSWRFRCWRGTSVVGVALQLLAWRQRLLRTARITLILNSKHNILKYIKCNCSEAILFCKCK